MKLIKYFLILTLLNISILANVKLKSSNNFIKGEPFIFLIEAVGTSIEFPEIKSVDGYLVENIGTSKSLQIVNGNYDEKISKRYKIVPNDDFVLPSFTFLIDGKELKTEEKRIVSQKVSKTRSNYFDLTLNTSNRNLYIGEDLLVKLVFKYQKGLQITNLGFEQPHFNDFWYKKIDNSSKRYEENNYIVQELDFLLFPQKSGELTINPLRVDVQMIDTKSPGSFGFFTAVPKVVKVYSNELKFNVKELPKDINYIGDFNIKASIDNSKLKLGESVAYKLNIEGSGNFEDIQDIKLNIPKATVYDNKPTIKTEYKDGKYLGNYEKVYSIIPSESLEIPSITFKYFSKKDQKVITKNTKTFNIEVEKTIEKKVVLEKPKIIEEKNKEIVVKKETLSSEKLLFFILGVVVTLLIIGLYTYAKLLRQKRNKKDTPLIKLVKKSSNKDELMKLLVPYIKKEENLDDIIYRCQSNEEFKALKKEALAILKDLKI